MTCGPVARSENGGGGHIVMGGDNVPPLVEIGLTDLPKSGAPGPPACDEPDYVATHAFFDFMIFNYFAGAFRRVHQNEEEVTIVKQMPRGVEGAHQPTIAVITAQYFEKMAVDAMMANKQTFMRYATVGKGFSG